MFARVSSPLLCRSSRNRVIPSDNSPHCQMRFSHSSRSGRSANWICLISFLAPGIFSSPFCSLSGCAYVHTGQWWQSVCPASQSSWFRIPPMPSFLQCLSDLFTKGLPPQQHCAIISGGSPLKRRWLWRFQSEYGDWWFSVDTSGLYEEPQPSWPSTMLA